MEWVAMKVNQVRAMIVASNIPHVGNGASDMIDICVCMKSTLPAYTWLLQLVYNVTDRDRARVLPAEAQDAPAAPNAQATRVHESILIAGIGAKSSLLGLEAMKQIRRPCYLNDKTLLVRLNEIISDPSEEETGVKRRVSGRLLAPKLIDTVDSRMQ